MSKAIKEVDLGVAIIGFVFSFMSGAALMWGHDTHRFANGAGKAVHATREATANKQPAPAPEEGEKEDTKTELERKIIAMSPNRPTKGNPNAKVTIVEVSDFQCPYCKRGEASMQEVIKNYGDKVKIAWKNLPINADSPGAAQAAEEAFQQKGHDGFWKMHDLLFENQRTPNGLKREALAQYAQKIGLDMAKFKTAMDNQTHKAKIDAEAKTATDAGINGTPAFIINGYFVSGAQPYSTYQKVIDRALAEAK